MILLGTMIPIMMTRRTIHLKKAAIGHSVMDLVYHHPLCHGNNVVNLVLNLAMEETRRRLRLPWARGLAPVVLVLRFHWKLLFRKGMVVLVVRRGRKLHLGSGDLAVLMLVSSLMVLVAVVEEILLGLRHLTIDLPGLAVIINNVLERTTAATTTVEIHLHRLLLLLVFLCLRRQRIYLIQVVLLYFHR